MRDTYLDIQANEFRSLILMMMRTRGFAADLRHIAENAAHTMPTQVATVFRTAVDPTRLTPETAPALSSVTTGFIEAQTPTNALDAIVRSGISVATLNAPVFVASFAAAGTAAEAAPKPVGEFDFTAAATTRSKALAIAVLSQEVTRTVHAGRVAQNGLRSALGDSTNDDIADILGAHALTITSSGTTYSAILADLRTASDALDLGAFSAPLLIVSKASSRHLPTEPGSNGQAFPDAEFGGGSICGVPIYVAPGLGENSPPDALLVDAARIAVADGGVSISTTTQANLEMDTAPAGSATVSLWQRNLVGIRIERHYALSVNADTSSSPIVRIVGAWG